MHDELKNIRINRTWIFDCTRCAIRRHLWSKRVVELSGRAESDRPATHRRGWSRARRRQDRRSRQTPQKRDRSVGALKRSSGDVQRQENSENNYERYNIHNSTHITQHAIQQRELSNGRYAHQSSAFSSSAGGYTPAKVTDLNCTLNPASTCSGVHLQIG